MSAKKISKDYQNEFTTNEDRLNRIRDRKHFIVERLKSLHTRIFKSVLAVERSKKLMVLLKDRFKL
jgi:hypothetical protein